MISVKFCMCELVSVHADWERVMFLNLGVCITVSKAFSNWMYVRWGRQCSWLRHYAASRKVLGSVPSGVIEIFH